MTQGNSGQVGVGHTRSVELPSVVDAVGILAVAMSIEIAVLVGGYDRPPIQAVTSVGGRFKIQLLQRDRI